MAARDAGKWPIKILLLWKKGELIFVYHERLLPHTSRKNLVSKTMHSYTDRKGSTVNGLKRCEHGHRKVFYFSL